MTRETFLLINLALAFYNAGTVWAHEVDIFRTWKLLDTKAFAAVQSVHWKKLPYWVFIPVGLSFVGSIALLWYHPDKNHVWEVWLAFGFQFLSHSLTAAFWGRWQAKLSKDNLGGASPYLGLILKTHWIRTALINAYALMLLYMTFQALS